MKRGEIDAIAILNPVISNLVHDGDVSDRFDTRTKKGLEELLGASSMSSAVVYTKEYFIKNNPNTAQALTNDLFSDAGMQAALKLLSLYPAIANAKIDLAKTIDDRFVKKANEKP